MVYAPIVFKAEYVVQVIRGGWTVDVFETISGGESGVMFGEIRTLEENVRLVDRADVVFTQGLDEPVLVGTVRAFDPSLGLGTVRVDDLAAEDLESTDKIRGPARGINDLEGKARGPRRFWNRIPREVGEHVVEVAREQLEKTPRELAWHITDTERYFISESSVYRILKAYDLIASPAYIVISAVDRFWKQTRAVHELWQTDFTYLKVTGWGWYYLSTVIDDFSRYIVAWRLCTSMKSEDVIATLDLAGAATGVEQVRVRHRTRLLSDNGSCYVSKELGHYLDEQGIEHLRGKPYHPMTQGKIERYHQTLKNVLLRGQLLSSGYPGIGNRPLRAVLQHRKVP